MCSLAGRKISYSEKDLYNQDGFLVVIEISQKEEVHSHWSELYKLRVNDVIYFELCFERLQYVCECNVKMTVFPKVYNH